MTAYFKRKMHPAWYQGKRNARQHFEGWYFKIVSREGRHLLAIIPGIFIDYQTDESHAFIQIFDGQSNRTHYFSYPLNKFHAHDDAFDIQIGNNFFSDKKIILDISEDGQRFDGELRFDNTISWPRTRLSPGIMGWYTWVPFMECYHGIVSLDHEIHGRLFMNGDEADFNSGRGYTEKDWGRSFPEAWIWCQSNHFDESGTSLTGSIAIIPWIRKPFLGFIFGLWHQHHLYRFTTYTGSGLTHFEIGERHVHWVLENKTHILEIRALRSGGGTLVAPTLNGMTHEISESLRSTISLRLFSRNDMAKPVFESTGRFAGFEIAGDIARLNEMYHALVH
ncbi:MAG: tocopherol cyclase family protein [candidate division KSB1 bacterium]|jgi:hypothetical protein|nr:tocopherol cyclase family protein [candidate division KSB1 bacterium]